MFRRPSFNATVLGAVIASLFSPYVAVAQSVPVQCREVVDFCGGAGWGYQSGHSL